MEMNELLIYTLKSALVLALLYLPYTLMLRRERFFRLNRATLLSILVLAVVLPLCRVSYSVEADEVVTTVIETQDLALRTEAMIVEANQWGVWQWLAFLYIIGVAIAFGYRLYQLLLVRRVIVRGSLWQQREADGITVYCHAGDEPSFSWMRSIVISQQDYEQNAREVLLHEQAHIRCRHSFDILLVSLIEVLQWWNPVVYLLDKSLRDVHEFEADDYVLQQGVSLPVYQTLLVRKAVQGTSLAFVNNFNRSSVRKRIEMMRRPPSKPWMRSKVLYVVPILALTLVVSARPVFEPLILLDGEEISGDHLKPFPKDSIDHVDILKGVSATTFYGEKGRGGAVIIATKKTSPAGANDIVYDVADEMPKFPGGDAAFAQYMAHHVRYPLVAAKKGVKGTVSVQFIVEPDGRITHVQAIDTPSEEVDAEVHTYGASDKHPSQDENDEGHRALREAAEELYRGMPPFEPGRKQGKPVRVRMTRAVRYC